MAWLGTYAKRIIVAVDHLKVTQDLFDFPVLLWLDNAGSGTGAKDMSCVFNEIGSDANRKKIAVADTTLTQSYVEIVSWDTANKKTELHFKAGFLSTANDTLFGLYYDHLQADNTAYVGDTTSTPAKAVWNSAYVAVYHMNDALSTTIADSTSNANTGTKGAGNKAPVEANGLVGKAQSFDNSNDYIGLPDLQKTGFMGINDTLTFEAILNPNADGMVLDSRYPNQVSLSIVDTRLITFIGSNGSYLYSASGTFAGNNTVVASVCKYGNYIYQYVNGSLSTSKITGVAAYSDFAFNRATSIGSYNGSNYADGTSYYYGGLQDEIRISNTARSAAWIKATNYSLRDTLVGYGIEEYLICPTGIGSQEALGSLTVLPGAVIIYPVGIESGEGFGTALIIPGPVTVYPVGISSDELLGLCLVYHLRKPPNRLMPSRLPVNRIKPSRM